MVQFALNQMTVADAPIHTMLDVAQRLGCVGVELRNDLGRDLFDGLPAREAAQSAADRGLRILALAEVYAFNDNTADTREQVAELVRTAQECGAEAVVLIPRLADTPVDRDTQRDLLRAALPPLRAMFEQYNVIGLIEPLGFANSTLRFKEDVSAVLTELDMTDTFALIHDTFHHHLAGETQVFAELTHVVHISGVTDGLVAPHDMTDAHRGLVDQDDQLGNLRQLQTLNAAGFSGPVSFEAFAPAIHALDTPLDALAGSKNFISDHLPLVAA